MGTNYYLRQGQDAAEAHWEHPLNGLLHRDTGRAARIHLGKSSGGWAFGLHVYPEQGWGNFDRILELVINLTCAGWVLEDEYGAVLTPAKFARIVHRSDWEPPPDGWKRHEINGVYCIGHGAGAFDYLIGEFG